MSRWLLERARRRPAPIGVPAGRTGIANELRERIGIPALALRRHGEDAQHASGLRYRWATLVNPSMPIPERATATGSDSDMRWHLRSRQL